MGGVKGDVMGGLGGVKEGLCAVIYSRRVSGDARLAI